MRYILIGLGIVLLLGAIAFFGFGMILWIRDGAPL